MKVREINSPEEKSIQEREEELLAQESQTQDPEPEPEAEEPEKEEGPDIDDELVLSHIRKRYNKDINSIDDLLAEQEKAEELPEDVRAYYEYRKKTGRGIQDYMKVQQNFDEMDDDQALLEYYRMTEDGLDDEDIKLVLEDFSYDEEEDEEKDIRKKKIAKKKAIAEARKYLKDQQEQYKAPLESSKPAVDNEEYEQFKQYLQDSNSIKEQNARKSEWFTKKTDEVFSEDFKGFEVKLDDKSFLVKLGDAKEIKKQNSSPMNLLGKFLNTDGFLEDAEGYHRALAIAMNPEKFARFFYEQGESAAKEGVTKRIKNIDMSERSRPEVTKKGGVQVKAVSDNSGRGLKIKKR